MQCHHCESLPELRPVHSGGIFRMSLRAERPGCPDQARSLFVRRNSGCAAESRSQEAVVFFLEAVLLQKDLYQSGPLRIDTFMNAGGRSGVSDGRWRRQTWGGRRSGGTRLVVDGEGESVPALHKCGGFVRMVDTGSLPLEHQVGHCGVLVGRSPYNLCAAPAEKKLPKPSKIIKLYLRYPTCAKHRLDFN